MGKRIAIIQGHPDTDPQRLGRRLSAAYLEGARTGGHETRLIDVAALDFPLLHSQREWMDGAVPATLREAQSAIGWAEHLVICYPLWLGTMPALMKGFLEQTLRPGFALDYGDRGRTPRRLLKGRSARIVVTMGMPVFFYRWYFRAHSLKNLERNILRFCGVGPIRETLIGLVEGADDARRKKWLDTLRGLGERGE